MEIKVEITQEDINHGGIGFLNCPIALALNRKFPEKQCYVGYFEFQIGNKTYNLPDDAYNFREKYDINGPLQVKPFNFSFNPEKPLCEKWYE